MEHTQGVIGQVKSVDRQRSLSEVDKSHDGQMRYNLPKLAGRKVLMGRRPQKGSGIGEVGLRSWRPGKALMVKRGSGVGWLRRPEWTMPSVEAGLALGAWVFI